MLLDPPEEWREVVGYEGVFQVSNYGQIKRVGSDSAVGKHYIGRIRKPQPHKDGYWQIDLSRGQHRLIHKIVMEAFIGPCPVGMEVNHKDSNRKNNQLANLEYVTPKQNVRHSMEYGNGLNKARGECAGLAKLTANKVKQIRKLFSENSYSYRSLGRMFSVDGATIRAVILRHAWKHIK